MSTETKYKPDWVYYVIVWGPVSILAGVQGWFTGDAVMTVIGWFNHLT